MEFPNSFSEWENILNIDMKNFLSRRPCIVEYNIAEFFHITAFDGIYKIPAFPDNDIILAPNPSSGVSFLYNNHPQNITVDLELYNMAGQLYFQQNQMQIDAHSKNYLQFRELPSQTYFLKVKTVNFNQNFILLINK